MDQRLEYDVRAASTDDDLRGIIALQAANTPAALDPTERRDQGFVTLRHDVALLREMMDPWPHLIATPVGGNDVVAYALVMLVRFRDRFADLNPMFEQLDRLARPGGVLDGRRYYIMGQVCVAKSHRGRGLVERLYAAHRAQMASVFDFMITVIDAANTRSIRAHEKAGCTALHTFSGEDGRDWVLVSLRLRPDALSPISSDGASHSAVESPATSPRAIQ